MSFPEPVNEGKVPGRTLLIVSVLLIAAAYGGWSYVSSSGKPIRDMVPAVPERLQAFLQSGETASEGATGDGQADLNDFSASTEGTNDAGTGTQDPASDPDTQDGAVSEPSAGQTGATETTEGTASAPETGTAGEPAQADRSEVADVPDTTDGAATTDTSSAPGAPEPEAGAPSGRSDGGDTVAAEAGDGSSGGGEATTTELAPPPESAPAAAEPAPSNSAGGAADTVSEDGSPGRTQTASIPETPTVGDTSETDATRGATGDRRATQTGGTTEDGIPEAPDADSDTATEPETASTGAAAPDADAQTSAPPEPPGSDDSSASPGPDSAASAANGAQAQVLAKAERVFGEGNADSRLLLRATQDSWVQVRGSDDSLLMTRVLNPGDVYRVPNREGLVLHTGNAGGLRVYVDGKPVRSLGDSGEVRRNVALNPEKLQ